MKFVKSESVSIEKPIMNWDIYPRHEVDSTRVNEYYNALLMDSVFPPIKVDIKTKWIVDGFHRMRMYQKAKKEAIKVDYYSFDNEAELIWWSINWNAQHGLKLTQYDVSKCINLGREMGLSDEELSKALVIPMERIKKVEMQRIRYEAVTNRAVEVKKVLSNITTTTVTEKQLEAQKPFNAMRPDYSMERAIDSLLGNLIPVDDKSIQRVIRLELACKEWLTVNNLATVSG